MDGDSQGTLTILFTDVEGSTAYRTRAGDAAGNQVMAAHDRLVTEAVAAHEGRLIKSLGDGCLAVFSSPRRAVECAMAVQRATVSAPLRVRIGLNAGEVTLTGGDVFGAPVNAAARIAAKAQGGEIFVSDIVRQLMGSTSGVELRDRGRVRLRGFPDRWRLYEVVWRDERAAGGNPELTPFVGRAAELARCHRVLDNLSAGRGAAIVIRGEAGIGKTRLATEALDYAQSRGWRVLTGRASPFAGGLGLEPIVEAFGTLLRSLDRAAVDALVGDLPHLARLFDGLGLPAAPPLGDAALERTLLFESVARLLERLARETPTVLLIDDIQWADVATLELLHQLGRGIERQPAALMFTHRSGEPGENERLRQLLLSLRRARVIEDVELSRLEPAAVEALAREFLGGQVPPSLLEILVRAAGTPLFVDAFLRALVEGGSLTRTGDGWTLTQEGLEVPTAVRELILSRLDGLDPGARRVVDLVALTGAELSYDVLAETGELEADVLSGAVESLTSTGVLTEEVAPDDLAYRLAHPLYYEVAAGALSEIGRRRGHATLAIALERVRPADLEGLGRHYLGAGSALDPTRALDVLAEAGARASKRRAYVEAVPFLDAAVALARKAETGDGLAPLLEQLAEARHGAGQTDAAVASWTEVLTLHHPTDDAAAGARVRRAVGMAEFDRGELVEARDHLEAAAVLLAGEGLTPALADLNVARVTVLRRLGSPDELVAVADQLHELAEALGSTRTRAQAHYARGAALADTGHYAEALTCGRDGLTRVREAADDGITYRLHTICADVCSALGDHAGALEHSIEGHRLASTMGVGILAGGGALFRVFGAVQSGAWAQAMAYSDEDAEIARRFDNERLTVSVLGIRAWLLTLRGDLDEAEELIGGLNKRFTPAMRADRRGFSIVPRVEAHLALERGQPDRALVVLAQVNETPFHTFAWMSPTAEARARAGDLAGAREAATALRLLASPFMAAEAAYVEGLVGLAEQTPEQAAVSLAGSTAAFDALAMPFYAARSRLGWARALVPLDTTAATVQSERALAVFEAVGAKRYAERTRSVLGSLGVRSRPESPKIRSTGPLSPREVEVAVLVAEGLTNAEIAERLTVSVRTVTSHLDHIYTRLGIGNRVALARHVGAYPAEFGASA